MKFKNNKIEKPEIYLGARLQIKDINGHQAWNDGFYLVPLNRSAHKMRSIQLSKSNLQTIGLSWLQEVPADF